MNIERKEYLILLARELNKILLTRELNSLVDDNHKLKYEINEKQKAIKNNENRIDEINQFLVELNNYSHE